MKVNKKEDDNVIPGMVHLTLTHLTECCRGILDPTMVDPLRGLTNAPNGSIPEGLLRNIDPLRRSEDRLSRGRRIANDATTPLRPHSCIHHTRRSSSGEVCPHVPGRHLEGS